MRAATRSAARSFPAPSRPFSSSPRVQRAGGWDNKPRPGEDSLAHALKSLSSRTRLTRPQTEAYTAIFKQASRLADRHDFNNSTQSRTFRPDDSNLDSLPFDVVMTAMAEADSSRLTLEHDALAYISYVSPTLQPPLTSSSPKITPASSPPCWSRRFAMTITLRIYTKPWPSKATSQNTPNSSYISCLRCSIANCSRPLR